MKKSLKKLFVACLCLCTMQAARSQQCPETYDPIDEPLVQKTILFQSKSTLNLKSLVNKNQVGQSFLATAPYLKKIITDFDPPASGSGNVLVKLYVYDSENHPMHREKILWQTSIAISSWNNTIIPASPIYVKSGLTYYLSFENLSTFDFLNCKRDYNPHGSLYINGVKSFEFDLNVQIEGGYPMEGYKDLSVYNHLNSFNNNPANTRNFQCHEIGQTFIALTPYIKSVKLATGANPTNEKAIVRIFEFDETKNRRTFNQIGEACTGTMGYYTPTLFDWEASGASMPLLKVGKKYYIQAVKEKTDEYPSNGTVAGSYKNFHVYVSNIDVYKEGEMYIDGKIDPTNDMHLEIIGIDPNAKKELMVNTINSGDQAWLVWYPAAGLTFKATNNYINSVTVTVCSPNTLNLRIYKYSGNADPRGELIKEVLNITPGLCGPTFIDFSPVPVLPGKDYYVEYSSVNYASTITIYGPPYKNIDNYMYGDTYFRNMNGTYQISTQPGPVNLTIDGIKTGVPYMGWAVGVNDHSGFYFNEISYPYSVRFNHFINSIEEKAKAYNDIGAYWPRFAIAIDDSLMANLQLADAFFDRLEDKNIGGVVWVLGYGSLMPDNELSFESSEDFYTQAEIYSDRAALLAERYKGCNVIWEVMNEPGQTGGTVLNSSIISNRQYTYLAQLTAKKIKKVDPSALIGGGGPNHLTDWVSQEMISQDLGDYIDFFTYHPYFMPMPEYSPLYQLEGWIKSLRLEFAKNTRSYHVPTFISTEFGAGQKEWEAPFPISKIRDNGYYNITPYMYYVHISDPNAYNLSPKYAGQTFKGTGQSIKWIALNIGSVNSGMRLSLYKYSGNPLNPKGTLLGTVDQTGVAPQWGFAEFKFTSSPIVLKRDELYYVEFYKTNGTALHVYGNDYSKTLSNEYSLLTPGPNGSTVTFDGQAYMWDGVSANYSSMPGDLNMKIWKAGMIDGGDIYEEGAFVQSQICTSPFGAEVREVGAYSEGMQAIYNSRYILNQLKNNVPLSIVYKDGDDASHQGVFYPDRWLAPFLHTYIHYKKPSAYMIKNLSKYFGEAFSDPTMPIFAGVAYSRTNHVAKYNEATKTLVIAVWQTIPAENSGFQEAIGIAIKDVAFATTPVTVKAYTGITLNQMGEQSGVWLDGSSGTVLWVNNVVVGAEPVIVTIQLNTP